MWLSVDRIEGRVVVLIDDDETVYHLTAEVYAALTGRAARESDMLDAEVQDGGIVSATYSEDETVRRITEARARLDRLFGRSKQETE